MAKKVVAGGGNRERTRVKCIKMERSPKTGAYVFSEEVLPTGDVQNFFKSK